MGSRLVATVEQLVADMTSEHGEMPPMLTMLITRVLGATPPADEDIVRTFDVLRKHFDIVQYGSAIEQRCSCGSRTCDGRHDKSEGNVQ